MPDHSFTSPSFDEQNNQFRCLNPTRCEIIAERKNREFARRYDFAERIHTQFLSYPRIAIMATKHAVDRMHERDIFPKDIRPVVECCEPIEFMEIKKTARHPQDSYRFIFCGEDHDGYPLHVVGTIPRRPPENDLDPWTMYVNTVYRPDDRAFEWNADFTQRICYCYGVSADIEL